MENVSNLDNKSNIMVN